MDACLDPLDLGKGMQSMVLDLVPGTPTLNLAGLLAGTASTPFGYLQATRIASTPDVHRTPIQLPVHCRGAPLLALRIVFVGRHALGSSLAVGAPGEAAATALCPLGRGAASGVGRRRGGRRLGGRHDGCGRSGGAGVAGADARGRAGEGLGSWRRPRGQ